MERRRSFINMIMNAPQQQHLQEAFLYVQSVSKLDWPRDVMWSTRSKGMKERRADWLANRLIGSPTDWFSLTDWMTLWDALVQSILFADVVISWSHWFVHVLIYCRTYLLLQYLLLRSTELLVSSWPDLLICCFPCLLISSSTVSRSTAYWFTDLIFY